MKFKKRLVGLMLATALTTFTGAIVSCAKDKDEDKKPEIPGEGVPFPGAGDYYYSAVDGDYSLSIGSESVTLTIGGVSLTGVYGYDETTEKLTMLFATEDETGYVTATATLSDYGLTLDYGEARYEFLKKETYKVSFNVDGGNAMADVDVMNGKTLQKPSDAVKEGYWFVGWYADAAFKKAYDFNAPVHGATTLYARFAEKSAAEFTVTYMVDGAEYATAQTRGGKIYNVELPTPTKEGKTFAGWWVSDYEDETKLTYKYDENKLGQNTTLYAVWEEANKLNVSVTENGVSWNALSANQSPYSVKILDSKGATKYENTFPSETNCAVDFSKYDAGEYTITVSVASLSVSTTAYYKNKALDKVSHFQVDETRLLTFNAIEGAEKYLITIDCGDETHEHTKVETTTPAYNFATCAMKEGGINITVQAVANGYMSSEEVTYNFNATLGVLTGLNVDAATELASWDAVENATDYVVEIFKDGVSLGTKTIQTTSISLRGLSGNLEVKVTPKSRAYNSSATQTTAFNNPRLAVPMNLSVDTETNSLVWTAVDGATGYTVTIAGKEYKVTAARFELLPEHFTNNLAEITVQATCADASKTSLASDKFTVRVGEMSDNLSYANGSLSWQAVLGAAKYGVKIGDGVEFFVTSNQTTLNFTSAGNTVIKVRCYNSENEPSSWVETTVKVYEVKFDVDGGTSVDSIYKAAGDQYSLGDLTSAKEGYSFAGWYDAKNNGGKYDDELTQGSSNLTLYANWTANTYTVTLVPGDFASCDTQQTLTYDQMYTLPVPTSTDQTKIFAGWRTEPNGQGVERTDLNGKSIGYWKDSKDNVTLYASWYSNIFSFEAVKNSKNQTIGWEVSKGTGIYNLTEVTIPVNYNGLPVIRIDQDAFESCSLLTKIRIPNTIQDIFMPESGGYSKGSPFYGCTKLEAFEVYGDPIADQKYESANGAILYNNAETGYKEIRFIPRGVGDTYYIPDGVTAIPVNAFAGATLKTIVIPASVVQIDEFAFKGASFLTELNFLASASGTEESLQISAGAFSGCKLITELNLPKRIATINTDLLDDLANLEKVVISGKAASSATNPYSSDESGVVYQGSTLVYYPRAKSGYYAILGNTTTIASKAFKGATRLTGVRIPANVQLIQESAFEKATELAQIDFEGTADSAGLTIEKKAFYQCYADGLTELTLPENLVKLEAHAFGYTENLGRVYLNVGEGAVLEAGAFAKESGVYYLVELYIGGNVKDIEIASVFGDKLKKVEVDKANESYASQDGVLFNKTATTIVYFPASKTGSYTLPATVTSISDNVFRAKKLEEINIPATVTEIGNYAFYGCSSLTSINFLQPDASEQTLPLTIGDHAFEACDKLTALTVSGRVTSVGAYAFANLRKLESVTFLDGAEDLTIGDYAFANYKKENETVNMSYGNSVLSTIKLPSNLKKIGENAFESAISSSNGIVSAATVDVVIPEGVEEIGDNAFANNTRLRSVALPASLKKLGKYNSADELTGLAVFENCPHLTTISVAAGSESFASVDGVLYNAAKTELYLSPRKNTGTEGSVVIPNTVKKIWAEAFYQNRGIASISFSGAVDSSIEIGADVFKSCTGLTRFVLPEGITTVTSGLFDGCSALVEITIPWTVGSMEELAFYGCGKLRTVNFQATPEGETEVPLVFEDCTPVTSNLSSSAKSGIFIGCSSLETLVLPDRTSSIGAYAFYNLKLTSVNIPKNVKSIGKCAFKSNSNLTTVTFDSSNEVLTKIPESAFESCKKLTGNIELPANIAEIEKNAFDSTAITGVTLPSKLETIGDYAFNNVKLASIAFPATLKTIGDYAFNECLSLATVTFDGDALTEIGDYAFNSDREILSLAIPSSVQKIGKFAFSSCLNLTTITFGENSKLQSLGEKAFRRTDIASFTFPETFEVSSTSEDLKAGSITLGASLFSGCLNLTTVHLSTSVHNITSAFDDCDNLDSITVAEGHQNFSTKAGKKILYSADGKGILYIYSAQIGEIDFSEDGLTQIGDYVFQDQSQMTKIILPNTLQSIGKYAFKGCSALKVVEFKEKEGETFHLQSIDNYAFAGTPITSITLPDSVTKLGANVFEGCEYLTSATLSKNLTTIGTKAFYKATRLTSVTLPEGMTTIGDYMFANSGLESVEIPVSVTKIGTYAFNGCKDLETVAFAKPAEGEAIALTSIGNYAFASCTKIESFAIPASVTTLGTYAFNGCTSLATVNIPDVKKIPDYAFSNTAITSVTIPANVQEIGNSAFSGCKSLTTLVLSSKIKNLGTSAFATCEKLSSDNLTIPEDIELTDIGISAFNGCKLIKSFAIPAKVKTIGNTAFASTGLTSIDVPEGVTSLGQNVFKGCASLKSATLGGKSLTTIGTAIFDSCNVLNSVTLRDGLTVIGASMFSGSSAATAPKLLTTISIPSTVTTIGASAFKYSKITVVDLSKTSISQLPASAFESASTKEVKLPASCVKFASGKTFYKSSITTIDLSNVTYFNGASQFESCTSLTTVTFGSAVTYAGSTMFKGCTQLNTVNFKEGFALTNTTAAYQGTNMFENCTKLTKVKFPSTLTRVSNNMFKGCTKLETVESWGGVESIGSSAFYGTSVSTADLSNVTSLGSSAFYGTSVSTADLSNVTSLGASAFQNCKKLTSVALSNSITEIGSNTFNGCVLLDTITLPNALTKIGQYAFKDCSALTSISIPSTVSTIDAYAFRNCGLTSIDLSQTKVKMFANGTTISLMSTAYTFADCVDLEEVKLPQTLEQIGGYVFKGCTSLKSISIPDSVTMIAKEAFMDTGLTSVRLPAKLESLGDSVFSGSPVASYSLDSSCEKYQVIRGALYTADGVLVGVSANMISDGVLTLPDSCSSFVGPTSTSGVSMFAGLEVEEVVLPDSVTAIPDKAFKGMESLKRITIPASVTSLGQYAFSGCTALEEVTFEDGDTELTMKASVFEKCTALTTVNLSSRIKTLGDKMFGGTKSYACSSLENVTIPEGVEKIGADAFAYMSLTSITLPSTLKTIGKNAFKGVELTSIDLKNVETIGQSAFEETTLASIEIPATVKTIEGSAFKNVKITSVTIPATVESWGSGVFQENELLETVVVSEGVKEIPSYMFSGCALIKNVNLPKSLTYIAPYAFQATGLTSIVIPENVTSLAASESYEAGSWESGKNGAFQDCADLVSVTLPDGLTAIGGYLFKGCSSLKEIAIPASVAWIGESAFEGTAISSIEIKNPEIVTYMSFQKMTQLEEVKLPDGLTAIGYKAFLGCVNLENIEIPSSVEYFTTRYLVNGAMTTMTSGGGAFQESGLKTIQIPEGVTEIPSNTFYKCAQLSSVEIGDNVTEIKGSAFYECSNLTKVTVGALVKTIGTSAFYNCKKLVEVYNKSLYVDIEADATTNGYIGKYAKNVYTDGRGSSALTLTNGFYIYNEATNKTLVNYIGSDQDVVVPDDVTIIGANSFLSNDSIRTLTVGASVCTIQATAFSGCYNLYKVTLGEKVDSIESGAFATCYKLFEVCNKSKLTLETGATTNGCVAQYAKNVYTPTEGASKIVKEGDFVFYVDGEEKTLVCYLGSAKDVVIPEGVTAIGEYAFYNAKGVVNVTATGNTIKKVGKYAFAWNLSKSPVLKSVNLGTAVETVEDYAFKTYTSTDASLETVALGSNLKAIGDYAFQNQATLAAFGFGSQLTEIGIQAFASCKGLAEITLPASLQKVGSNAFTGWDSAQKINVVATEAVVDANDDWATGWLGTSKATVVYDCLTPAAPAPEPEA